MAERPQLKGNPYYPLPADYTTLTGPGQRLARLNAVALQETPEDLVTSWAFFRRYYLEPEEVGWYKRWKPSPPTHYQLVHDIGTFSRNAWAAPRAYAKSTLVTEMFFPLTLGRPNFHIAALRATDRKSRKHMSQVRRQFETNRLLKEDYGELQPPRGRRVWNTELLELPNGSRIEGLSVNGALRGDRPDFIVVDDAEYDEDDQGDTYRVQRQLESFETLLFKVILGMLEDGAGIAWIGTLISRSSFLYHVVRDTTDPRFRFWNRRILSATMPDGSLLWEAKWDEQALRDKRLSMGDATYSSEMMNDPGTGAERILHIHPDFCTYAVKGAPEKEEDPLQSMAEIEYTTKGSERITMPFGEFAQTLYRVALVDYASTVRLTSDFSCILVLGFDTRDTLWILDGFLARVREDALVRRIWHMSYKWRCRATGVEAVSIQKTLADRVASSLSQMSAGTQYIPRVLPIKYPARAKKEERMMGLEWRFNQHKIRFPTHRSTEFPIAQLIQQVEGFTPDLSRLRWDDAIDTLAMHQYLVRRQGSKRAPALTTPTPLESLKQGEFHDERTGLSHMSGLDAADLDQETLHQMHEAHLQYGHDDERDDEITQRRLEMFPCGPRSFHTLG